MTIKFSCPYPTRTTEIWSKILWLLEAYFFTRLIALGEFLKNGVIGAIC